VVFCPDTHANLLGREPTVAGHVLDNQRVIQAQEFDIRASEGLVPHRGQTHFSPAVLAVRHGQHILRFDETLAILLQGDTQEPDDLANALADVGELLVVVEAEAVQVLE
jgi:hypothetical protein